MVSVSKISSITTNNFSKKRDIYPTKKNNSPVNISASSSDSPFSFQGVQNPIIYKTQKHSNLSFRGIPQRLPYRFISGAQDAIEQWNLLKSAKYSDVHDDLINIHTKQIREDNYSFLDKLVSNEDKNKFVQNFKVVTGFPNLSNVSTKMQEHFVSTIRNISNAMNRENSTDHYISLFCGFDPLCSIGLKKSFPGSDLDKAYIILKGDYQPSDASYKKWHGSETGCVDRYKGQLWEQIDQRLVSLNNKETFPEVLTINEVISRLKFLDDKAREVISEKGKDYYLALKNSQITDPLKAAEFNTDVAKKLFSSITKESAKNMAFFLESLAENQELHTILHKWDTIPYDKQRVYIDYGYCDVAMLIKNSPFVELSNVTQMNAWKNKISGGYLKQKLVNRQSLEKDFDNWPIEKQYNLVKNIIRKTSEDQGDEFSFLFKNDDDIKARFNPLLEKLR